MQHFTTEGLRRADVLSYWHDYICKTYFPVDFDPCPLPGFGASGGSVRLARTVLTQVKSDAARYTRTRRNIRISDHGDYLLTYLKEGNLKMRQHDRVAEIRAGDLCLFDTSQPYDLDFSGRYTAIHVQIERDEMDRRLPLAKQVSAMRVAGEGRYARLAATMLQSTIEIADVSAPRQLAPTLIDLVALAFDESFSDLARDASRYSRIVARAQEVMMDNLLDPTFDPGTIPGSIGVSSRTLSRAFAQMGQTPSKWMWSKRLETARDMLQAGRGRSVSEVAMACGFNDFSHFSRAFKARFNVSPVTMRNGH